MMCAVLALNTASYPASAHTAWLGDAHKYTKLLWICATVMIGGCLLFWIGGKTSTQGDKLATQPAA